MRFLPNAVKDLAHDLPARVGVDSLAYDLWFHRLDDRVPVWFGGLASRCPRFSFME